MTIYQAAVKAGGDPALAIRRSGWPEDVAIIPTNKPECCLLLIHGTMAPRWQPTAEDLTAEDWETRPADWVEERG